MPFLDTLNWNEQRVMTAFWLRIRKTRDKLPSAWSKGTSRAKSTRAAFKQPLLAYCGERHWAGFIFFGEQRRKASIH